MGAVKQLCSRALLLQDGQYICYGEVAPTLDRYAVQAKNSHSVFERHDRKGNGVLKIANLEFMDKAFFLRTVFFPAEELNIKISLLSEEKIVSKDINYRIDIGVDDLWGTRIAWLSSSLFCNSLRFSEDNKNVFFSIPKLNLAPGKYDLTVCVHVENEVADWMSHVGSFSVEQGKYYPHGMISQLASGYFFLDYDVNSSLREDIKCIP